MQLSTLASLIKVVFAASGTKNAIPDDHSDVPTPANAANDTGFPSITMTPVSAGGIPPFGADMNGVLFALANALQSLQSGAVYAYSSAFSTAIGGYAKGSIVLKSAGTGYWVSTADSNTSNPDTGGANWSDLATFLSALGRYIDPLPTGSASVMTPSITIPTLNTAMSGAPIYVRAIGANSITNPTYDGKTIVKGPNLALAIGDIAGAGHWICLEYDVTFDALVLLNPATGVISQLGDIRSVGASVASSILTATFTLPTALSFRNPTLTNGAPVSAIPGSMSIAVPAGATLGTVSGQSARLIQIVAYNAGTPVKCIVNLAGGLNLDETGLISPTTISGSANSAGVIYSASAVAANGPYRVVGAIDIPGNTGSAWGSGPTLVQGVGGEALAGLSTLGYGQAWQAVTRSTGTTYYNTTGRPIMLGCAISTNGSQSCNVTATIGGVVVSIVSSGNATTSGSSTGSIIVPPGPYTITISSGIISITFQELR